MILGFRICGELERRVITGWPDGKISSPMSLANGPEGSHYACRAHHFCRKETAPGPPTASNNQESMPVVAIFCMSFFDMETIITPLGETQPRMELIGGLPGLESS